jgi:non-ribosomal peptide synthetase component F
MKSEKEKDSIIDLIYQNCSLSSNNTAILDESTKTALSYGELLDKVTSLSEILGAIIHLRSETCDEIVPIVTIVAKRSIGLVLSILVVLKARAAFNLFDAANFEKNSKEVNRSFHSLIHPRCKLMIVDVVFAAALHDLQLSLPPLIIINSDGDLTELNRANLNEPHTPMLEIEQRRLAYVFYPPVSSGTPLGAQVTHKGFLSSLLEFSKLMKVTENDRVLFYNDLSLEITLIEIFLPLISNATLVIFSSSHERTPERIITALQKFNITVLFGNNYWINKLLEGENDTLPWKGKENLKIILDCDDFRSLDNLKFLQLIPTCQFVCNIYIIPENSLVSSCFFFSSSDLERDWSNLKVPLGRPLPHVKFHLLNDDGRESIPDGEIGDLYVSGDGVSLGYYAENALTELKFLPMAANFKEKVFQTGDLVKKLNDGNYQLEMRTTESLIKFKGYK